MISKTSYEEIFRYHEFYRSDGKGWLTASETIITAAVTAKEKDTGADVSAAMISDVAPYGSPLTKVKYKLKAGTADKVYIITIQITTSNNQKFEDNIGCYVV